MDATSSRRGTLGARIFGWGSFASLAPAFGVALLATGMTGAPAEAKTPGKTYCFYGKCHRVKTIAEMETLIGSEETISASHYDSCKRDRYNPCGLTSSGEAFDSESPDNAASPVYPDGTTLLVWSPATRVSVVLRVNNAGPYWGDRKLDVSRRAAEVLGFAGDGVATLKVRVIGAPTLEEATYKKNRRYDPVPGYIGQFASLDEAQAGAANAYMVAGLPSPFATTVAAVIPTASTAGSAGTQSGATMIPPTVVAAADVIPAPVDAVVVDAALAKPVQVASLIAVRDVEQVVADAADAPAEALRAVKRRATVERTAKRNSRSYRVAAKQKPVKEARPVDVAEVREPEPRTVVTRDGTNDMSIFSRHVYAGIDRIASEEPARRRAQYSSAGRYARDANDG